MTKELTRQDRIQLTKQALRLADMLLSNLELEFKSLSLPMLAAHMRSAHYLVMEVGPQVPAE